MDPIQAELEQLGRLFPGAALYIENADGSSRFYTTGYADLDTRALMAPDSHYRIGSTTKTFTAVVALQLVAEGKLALHDTMQALLPDLPISNAGLLTVEHLLRMRSGLCDFEDDPALLGNLEAHFKPWTLVQVVEMGIRGPTQFLPGEKYSYCNTNFCVLEVIIERITGQSLAAELERRIFQPLGLHNTGYPDEQDLTLPEPYIRGYERTDGGWRECSEVFFGRGDGAIISTAPDLARFFRALLAEQTLLPPDLLRQMMHVMPDDPPAEYAYGLGLMAGTVPCGVVWGHSGGGFGYGDLPYLRLETDRFAVVIRNGSFGYRQALDPDVARQIRYAPELRALAYC